MAALLALTVVEPMMVGIVGGGVSHLRLPDGTRLHAVLAPVARPGTTISLRLPPRRPFSLPELMAAGHAPPDIRDCRDY